jgi:hypothetical protein
MTNAPTTHQAENMMPLHPVERGDRASCALICKSRAFDILCTQPTVLYLFSHRTDISAASRTVVNEPDM